MISSKVLNCGNTIIGRGSESLILKINEKLVARIPKRCLECPVSKDDASLRKELHIQRRVHSVGISSAKPYGISLIESTIFGDLKVNPGLILELLIGVNGEVLARQNITKYWKARNQYGVEIRKAIRHGITPKDVNDKNYLFNFEEEIVYVCDTARWIVEDSN